MPSPIPPLQRIIDIQRLVLKFQSIERHICYTNHDLNRPENDVEHSYSLALTGWFLASHFPELDQERVLKYALAHDLVEIYAGDTSVFADPKQLDSKAEREANALIQLEKEWPDFADLIEQIKSYEKRETDEARFVYALDKIMPVILNYIHHGAGWRKHGITIERLHDTKKDKVKTHPTIDKYYQDLYQMLVDSPDLFYGKPAV